MTSIVGSEARFVKRAQEIGLSDKTREVMETTGFKTLGQPASSVGQPGPDHP